MPILLEPIDPKRTALPLVGIVLNPSSFCASRWCAVIHERMLRLRELVATPFALIVFADLINEFDGQPDSAHH